MTKDERIKELEAEIKRLNAEQARWRNYYADQPLTEQEYERRRIARLEAAR